MRVKRTIISKDIKQPAPAVVALRLPGEERNTAESFIGKVLDRPVDRRLMGTAAAVAATPTGASAG